jgi:hypothetical protein
MASEPAVVPPGLSILRITAFTRSSSNPSIMQVA